MCEPPENWRRHDLLRVRPSAWARMLRSTPRLAAVPSVAEWAVRGWPLVVRRQSGEDAPGMIPAAFPLPPCYGKLRVPVQVAPEDVREWLPPLPLRDVRENAPLAWHGCIDALLVVADQTRIEPLVYGSLLWESLTGLPYLSGCSDLDLLWPINDQWLAVQLARHLAVLQEVSAVRFDGEILLPNGGGVQWREFHDNSPEVLVKEIRHVQLRPLSTLFAVTARAA